MIEKLKRGRFCTSFNLLLLVFMLASASSYSTDYIVKIKEGILSQTVSALSRYSGVKVKSEHAQGTLLLVTIAKTAQRAEVFQRILERSDVEYVVENINMHSFAGPNDPDLAKQWALAKINAFDAWNLSVGSKKVVVAVVDTGIDTGHEDLAANIWVNEKEVAGDGVDNDNNGFVDDVNGWDFLQNDNDPMDVTGAQNPGHGSHCAGIVGAVGNNEKGISGINQSVSLMPLRFLGENGQGDLMNAIKAIDYAVANGAHVISASFGATVPESGARPLIEAIDRAAAKGVIMVAAAANDGKNNDQVSVYPANAANLISVAASDSEDKKPSWSNYGQKKVHVAAPGAKIYSTLPLKKGKYGELSGTSMATPLVAGLVALMKSVDPDLTLNQARALLQNTGVAVDIKTACDCRVDASQAVGAALNKKFSTVPAAATIDVGGKLQFSAYGGKAPFTYSSSDVAVASISVTGELSGVAKGKVTVSMTDADGKSATSKSIWVGEAAGAPPGGAECPFQDPMFCMISCIVMPSMPWCEGGSGGEFPFPTP